MNVPETQSYHMSPAEFRRQACALADWLATYAERVETLPVLSPLRPGQVRARLPKAPPERGETFDAMLRDVEELILPGFTHWQSPSFFAYFPANTSGPFDAKGVRGRGGCRDFGVAPLCIEPRVSHRHACALVESRGVPPCMAAPLYLREVGDG